MSSRNGRCPIALVVCLTLASALVAQGPQAPVVPSQAAASRPTAETLTSKTFELKYIDPEQIRSVFSGQSYVIQVNRDLKLLTVRGSPAFLKEVEDMIKRLDVAPPIPPDVQISIYLLAAAAQAPTGVALPPELKAIEKELPAKMADMQMLRVRVGQAAETTSGEPPAPAAVSLSRVRVESTSVNPSAKGEVVSLNGLKVWINIPSTDPAAAASPKTSKNEPDVSVDLDVVPNQAVVVAKIGVDKPLAVVVRAVVVR